MVYYSVLTLVSLISATAKSPSPCAASSNPWMQDDPGLFFQIDPEGIHDCLSLDLSSLDPPLNQRKKNFLSAL